MTRILRPMAARDCLAKSDRLQDRLISGRLGTDGSVAPRPGARERSQSSVLRETGRDRRATVASSWPAVRQRVERPVVAGSLPIVQAPAENQLF